MQDGERTDCTQHCNTAHVKNPHHTSKTCSVQNGNGGRAQEIKQTLEANTNTGLTLTESEALSPGSGFSLAQVT